MSRDRQAHHKWLPQVLFSDIIIGKERIITVNVKSTELIGLTCSLRIDITDQSIPNLSTYISMKRIIVWRVYHIQLVDETKSSR